MMERISLRRALALGLLLTTSQIQTALAYPRQPIEISSSVAEQTFPSVSAYPLAGTEDNVLVLRAEDEEEDCEDEIGKDRIATQIADGQIQVPGYTTIVAVVPVTSSGQATVTTTTLTAKIPNVKVVTTSTKKASSSTKKTTTSSHKVTTSSRKVTTSSHKASSSSSSKKASANSPAIKVASSSSSRKTSTSSPAKAATTSKKTTTTSAKATTTSRKTTTPSVKATSSPAKASTTSTKPSSTALSSKSSASVKSSSTSAKSSSATAKSSSTSVKASSAAVKSSSSSAQASVSASAKAPSSTVTSKAAATTASSTVSLTTRTTTTVRTSTVTVVPSTVTVVPIASSSNPGSGSTAPATSARTTTVTTPSTSGSSTSLGSFTASKNTALSSLTVSAVQSASTTAEPKTSGTVNTSLESSGEVTSQPFVTSVATATSTISLINTSSTSIPHPNITSTQTAMTANNIFVAIATGAPPSQVTQRTDHPVPRLGVQSQTHKLETNKFYANFFLGSQSQTSFTHPYSVAWSKGSGGVSSWGLSISHIERSQLAYGPGNPNQYFINPIGIQSLILSAAELGSNTVLTTDSLEAFSVNVNLSPNATAAPMITFPLVQGMGFVTGVYSSGTPWIQSSVSILTLTYVGKITVGSNTWKYRAGLADGKTWLIYVTALQSGYPGNTFTLVNAGKIAGQSSFIGYIQIAKVPDNTADAETKYDASAGAYATSATISGSVSGTAGTYNLAWTKAGVTSQTLLMYALPHHVETLNNSTSQITDLQLETTTKGMATAVLADSWTLVEPNLPVSMNFAPWSPSLGSVSTVSTAAKQLINAAGESELSQDINQQTNLNSMYYSGKGLAKFAAIIYALHDVAGNATLAITGLQKLEAAFSVFVNNTQPLPLFYESAWGGAVSSGTYLNGDSGQDFGNTYYNDHHFHYGYFIYTAAVIGYLDPTWLDKGTNKAWVNMLVRDYANSVTDDTYFPFSRSFDWYHGHSWAKGLFESGDGKDQESSSEDTMASFGIKMWGRTVNDTAMEARGNLMLSIQARSLQHYFLYESDNTVEPASIIGNKVSGILFENKIDHTTYFGSNIEYIQGIHMIPLMPFSTLARTQRFVTEEWNTYFSNGRAQNVTGGWQGILMANLAIIDPVTSYNFFSNPSFDMGLLDGGASLTWYLTLSAALGGSPATITANKRSEPVRLPIHPKSEAQKRMERASDIPQYGTTGAATPAALAEGKHRVSRFLNRITQEVERRGF